MLQIRTADLDELRTHAEEAYPNECCGVLLGRADGDVRTVESTIRCANALSESSRQYFIDPAELIRVQREAREHGLSIVGFYHSHPDHPPRHSNRDLAEAHWTGCDYLIVSVQRGIAGDVNAYRLVGSSDGEKHFVRETVVTERIA